MQQQREGEPSGPPPPYPDDPTLPPLQASVPVPVAASPVERKPRVVAEDPDLKVCSHWHTLLVSLIEADADANVTVTPLRDAKQKHPASLAPRSVLHFWSPVGAPTKSSTHVPTQLTEENLRYIQGFQDLGAFTFPLPPRCSPVEIHDYLTSLSVDPSPGAEGNDSDDESDDAIEIIGAQLSLLPTSSDGPKVRMFTISVLGDSPDALFATGDAPAWKWAKPSNVYGRKTGLWEIEPAVAIEHASWEAGRDIMMLVRGFYEEHRAWMEGTPVPRLLEKGEKPPADDTVPEVSAEVREHDSGDV
ncbi:hypothetical protein F5X68DRAFT_199516 [Plectosphaerella plurivora]|uniref:Uncharacterized protein n=1 Tax=Plectosphaerella plurivora TaxID=936078 RepID=A0A9P9AGH9_9PEZI|nr:hypothetical protein F5X68DRAFT_199516 [Plectosphaerella plurivora]